MYIFRYICADIDSYLFIRLASCLSTSVAGTYIETRRECDTERERGRESERQIERQREDRKEVERS